MPLSQRWLGANPTAGRGRCLGGRPGAEVGDFGNLKAELHCWRASSSQARTLRREAASFLRVGPGKPMFRF